jgi:hypothetical protein
MHLHAKSENRRRAGWCRGGHEDHRTSIHAHPITSRGVAGCLLQKERTDVFMLLPWRHFVKALKEVRKWSSFAERLTYLYISMTNAHGPAVTGMV